MLSSKTLARLDGCRLSGQDPQDDDGLRRAIALLLMRRGVNVREVASGEAAVDLMEEIVLILYLIDQQLGDGMTGGEAAGRLHARFGARPTRIITADRFVQTRAAAGAGA